MNNETAMLLVGFSIVFIGGVTGYVLWNFLGACLVALGYLIITLVFLGAVEHEPALGPHQ